MSAGLLLAANLKRLQARINLQVRGDGPLGRVFVDAGLDGTVRGYVDNPAIELPLTDQNKLDVGQAIGRYGYLHVIRDLGYGHPFTSVTELVTGEIGDDVTEYLANSEQTPSALLLGVFIDSQGVQAAGGLLLQVMPGAPASLIPQMEQRLAGVTEFSPMLTAGKGLPEILHDFLGDLDLKILPDPQVIRFFCKCSPQRVMRALRMLGQEELIDMITVDKGAEATCHFCNQIYRLSQDDLLQLVEEIRSDTPSHT
jgi:molecular chaperone Hsp33